MNSNYINILRLLSTLQIPLKYLIIDDATYRNIYISKLWIGPLSGADYFTIDQFNGRRVPAGGTFAIKDIQSLSLGLEFNSSLLGLICPI